MTARAIAIRRARITIGHCPRCDQPVNPWPLRRADVCHAPGAFTCPRQWRNILAAETKLTEKS